MTLERIEAVAARLAAGEATAYDVARDVYGEWWMPASAGWLMTMTLCFLRHLEVGDRAHRTETEPERWVASV